MNWLWWVVTIAVVCIVAVVRDIVNDEYGVWDDDEWF